VSANYRVNAFGGLASQEITDAGVANLHLKDQRVAMEWVQKYITEVGILAVDKKAAMVLNLPSIVALSNPAIINAVPFFQHETFSSRSSEIERLTPFSTHSSAVALEK
jgi:hypothetical protein